ncbi:MAG: helix-turn-helix domain-containing protein [Bacteroidales bacterium]|nr:helix-turn-helix domain-containing protein [Bacteroidales bacterium]
MKTFFNKELIINRLKEANNFHTDKELADFLGISKTTISNWYRRNTIDFELVLSKCEHIDINWLLFGKNNSTHVISEGCPVCMVNEQIISSLKSTISGQDAKIAVLQDKIKG